MGSARAAAKRALRQEIIAQVAILGGTVALLWLVEIVDQVAFGGGLRQFGIKPRTVEGLIGIPLHPFLHAGFDHLASNTVGLVIPGWFVLNRRRRDYFVVWACATLVGGIGTWLVGASGSNHIGASGVVMGLMGCLIFRGWFDRRWLSVLGSVAMLLAWGGTVLGGLFPGDAHISWQVHLFGFLGGVLAAKLTRTPVRALPFPR